jgi:tetratricopeptide (TPR) repeat protein
VLTVFLSSTNKDLTPHREAVIQAINSLSGYKCICMEQFGARDALPAEFCRLQIASADLFVGIVGHIYGSIDPASGNSFTETEIAAAKAAEKPRLMFLLREDASFPIVLVESDALRKRQVQLRQRISAERIRDTFATPGDLAERVVRAIHNWEHAAGQHHDLIRPLPPQSSFEHPYPLQENFTGRAEERRLLTDWLARDARGVICVTAIGGMGKSALTWAWLQRDVLGLPLPGVTSEPSGGGDNRSGTNISCDGVFWWSFYEGESSFSAFLDSALYYVSRGTYESGEAVPDDHKVRSLVALLQQNRFLLALDGFERQLTGYASLNAAYLGDSVSEKDRTMVDSTAKLFFRHFLSVQCGSRILITSRLYPLELDGMAGCRRENLFGLSSEDGEAFLRAQGVSGGSVEIRAACERYGYHPLALRLMAGLVVNDPVHPGDIRVAPEHEETVVGEQLKNRQHHVLELAYNALDPSERKLLSQIAAFRFPVGYGTLEQTLCLAEPERKGLTRGLLNRLRYYYIREKGWHTRRDLRLRLTRLIARGLVFHDRERQRYDLHPIVRHYAYDRLLDKTGVHARARDYYALLPNSNLLQVKTIDDFAPTIELFHHTLRAGLIEQAFHLFMDRIQEPLLKHLCAAETYSMLVSALFPDGSDAPAGLAGKDRTIATACLAHSCRLLGRPPRAAELYHIVAREYHGFREFGEEAVTYLQLGMVELLLGRLLEAEKHLNLAISGCGEKPEYQHLAQETLALLLLIEGRSGDADQALERLNSTRLTFNRMETRALAALWSGNTGTAVELARRGAEIADAERFEMDRIRANCLLGTVLSRVAAQPGDAPGVSKDELLREADGLLKNAREMCLRIKLVEMEADVELARARWYAAAGQTMEARASATDALEIAERSEYRLKAAEACMALAEFALVNSELSAAEEQLGRARELALCDGPPHCYQPVLDAASQLAGRLKPAYRARFAV